MQSEGEGKMAEERVRNRKMGNGGQKEGGGEVTEWKRVRWQELKELGEFVTRF